MAPVHARTALRLAVFGAMAIMVGWAAARTLRASTGGPARNVRRITIDSPNTYWAKNGFVPLVAPLAAPTNADGTDLTVVWLKLPAGAVIRTRRLADGRVSLSVPPGTEADRVESIGDEVADVRGIRFEGEGRQTFHVLRPESARHEGGLGGYEWPRGDGEAERSATELLTADILGRDGRRPADRFRGLMGCAGCHPSDKPANRRPADAGLPNRPTDGSGLYQILAVLRDETPLESYRPRDVNLDNPFVQILCGDGGAPQTVRGSHDSARASCSDGSVPRGRLDVVAALKSGDQRARQVCQARASIAAHLDEAGKRAFAEGLRECASP
jgi:hypothetical protein